LEPISSVAIATPYVGPGLPEYYVNALWGLKRPPVPCNLFFVHNRPVDVARNALAKEILQGPFSHVLWLDSDMKWPVDLLARLLRHEKPIVSATYFSRTDMPIPHIYRYFGQKEDGYTYYTSMGREFTEWLLKHPDWKDRPNVAAFAPDGSELVECDAFGFGAVLMRREVLEAVGYPWFECDADSGGAEDFDFCEKARAKGYTLYADFSLQCDHEAKFSFIGRAEFADTWGTGEPDGYTWSEPVEVEVRANGARHRPSRKLESAHA